MGLFSRMFVFWVAVGFQINCVVATRESDLPSSFPVWIWQSSLVVGNWLYIDGGQKGIQGLNTQTTAIDLSQDFNTSQLDQINYVATNKNIAMTPARRPDLFLDPHANLVYNLGGWPYPTNPSNANGWLNKSQQTQIWAFTPAADGFSRWDLEAIGETVSLPLKEVVAGALTATSPTNHYMLGGFSNADDSGLSQFLNYNFANGSWTNQSITLPQKYYIYGNGQYVPNFGEEGVVLFFGGMWPSNGDRASTGALAGLDGVLVYDVHSNTLFEPQQTGKPPLNRMDFCSVGAGSNSSSPASYEIFVFGGSTGVVQSAATNATLAQVWILTLPAFQWIQTNVTAETFRAYHTCSVIGNRQMLSIGGAPGQVQPPYNWVDPWANGMHIFDMTDLVWTDGYNATAAAYQPPDVVKNFYATNSRYPKSWVDPKLATIFQTRPTDSGSSGADNTNAVRGGSTDTSDPSDTSSTSHVGAMAGGVVGGVAVLAIMAGVLFWYLRRKRQQKYPVTPTTDVKSEVAIVEADASENQVSAELSSPEQLRHELGSRPFELDGESTTFIANHEHRTR